MGKYFDYFIRRNGDSLGWSNYNSGHCCSHRRHNSRSIFDAYVRGYNDGTNDYDFYKAQRKDYWLSFGLTTGFSLLTGAFALLNEKFGWFKPKSTDSTELGGE